MGAILILSPQPAENKVMNRSAGLLLLVFLGSSCGGSGGSATYGTCDMPATSKCIESTGPAPSIGNQRTGCADAGGSWSSDPCPTANLVGCCSYTFGLQFRECFYTGAGTTNPEIYCTMTWDDGVWTPGP
jgi:hypothetical protein